MSSPALTSPRTDSAARGVTPAGRTRVFALPAVRWAAIATVLFTLGVAAQFGGAPAGLWWALYLACYLTGGWEPARAGLAALRSKTLDVDLLMIVAAIGAAAIGQVFDGGLLIVIFATSGALEAFLTQRTADSVRSLLTLAPDQTTVITDGGDEHVVDAATLSVGDVIVVRPGERIGADGQVLAGTSDVDQASITGEPLPVAKQSGDEVFAGTLNGTGMLRVRVQRAAADTVVARIVTMVQEASATKATQQLFIEKVEQYYSVGVVAATLAVFLAGDDVHDRRLPVRGGAGDDAAAAGGDGHRRPQRRAGQIRGRDGTTRLDHRSRVRQDRHPHRGHAPAVRHRCARGLRAHRRRDPDLCRRR
jgi:cation-transporting P-type ATPase J